MTTTRTLTIAATALLAAYWMHGCGGKVVGDQEIIGAGGSGASGAGGSAGHDASVGGGGGSGHDANIDGSGGSAGTGGGTGHGGSLGKGGSGGSAGAGGVAGSGGDLDCSDAGTDASDADAVVEETGVDASDSESAPCTSVPYSILSGGCYCHDAPHEVVCNTESCYEQLEWPGNGNPPPPVDFNTAQVAETCWWMSWSCYGGPFIDGVRDCGSGVEVYFHMNEPCDSCSSEGSICVRLLLPGPPRPVKFAPEWRDAVMTDAGTCQMQQG